MRLNLKLLAMQLFVTSIVFVPFAYAENPHNVYVKSIVANGTGCQSGTVSGVISNSADSFSLLFDNYLVDSNGNQQLDRKACQILVELGVPRGWSYAVLSADYRGFVNADAGSVATHQAIYSFDGSRPINERPGFENGPGRYSFKAQTFNGPISQNYFIHNEIKANIAPWSSCNNSDTQFLYVDTYLMARTLNNLATSTAMITLDSVDGAVQSQQYKFAWRRCTPGNNLGPRPRPTPPPRPRPDPGPRPTPRPSPNPTPFTPRPRLLR